MRKKIISAAVALFAAISCAWGQNVPEGVILPPVGKDKELTNYNESETGFWISGQVNGGYSLFINDGNSPYTEINVTGGYRMSQYLRFGVGFGGRFYFNSSHIRNNSIKWSFPIYANVRGNIIDDTYRTVVPYYSLDIGGAIQDGFFWRPTIGIRVGQRRSAFLLGISYMGQNIKYVDTKNKYASFLGLTLGYEY